MSDAACDQNNKLVGATTSSCSQTIIEEHWRKSFIFAQIWREVLRFVLLAGEPGEGLDEKSRREMWLLLVAAGSGYLARCWHKTLKPKPQLTDHSHDDGDDIPDPQTKEEDSRRVVDDNTNNKEKNLLASSSYSISQPLLVGAKETPLDAARIRKTPELAPKPLRRNFSPKAFGKKLFSSDGSKNAKVSKKESASSSAAAVHRSSASADAGDRETNRLTAFGGEKSSSQDAVASVAERSNSSRRSPWSSFRSHSFSKAQAREGSPGAADDDGNSSGESSPGCLKRAGDSFRKSRERRKSDNGSLSSRSLQSIMGADGEDGGSVLAELDPADSLYSSSGLTNRSLSTLGVAARENSEFSSEVGESPEVTSKRNAAVENEAKPSSPDAVSMRSSSSTTRKEAPSKSVAAVVARIEMGNASAKMETVNAVLSLRAANQAHAQGQAVAVTEIVKARKLKLEMLEQNILEEGEIPSGGKGKRRAGDGGGKPGGGYGETGIGPGLPAPLSTGKRTKDSNKSDSRGVTLAGITGNWTKDPSFVSKDDPDDFDEASSNAGFGGLDLSQVFFGFDSSFLGSPIEEKSPFKSYRRSRQLSMSGRRNMRKMRESPRPVSALESCLRAQCPDRGSDGARVARSLNFSSSSVTQREPLCDGEDLESGADVSFSKDSFHTESPCSSSDGREHGGGSEQQSPQQQTDGALGLPLLMTPMSSMGSTSRRGVVSEGRSSNEVVEVESKYPRSVVFEDRGRVVSNQSKITDVLWKPTTLPVALKKRKVSQACSPSTNSTHLQARGYELEALVIPPMEGLLFCFGMGIGVMSLIDGPDDKVERLSRELRNSEAKIENLNSLLVQARETSLVEATLSLSKEIVVAGRFSSDDVGTVEARAKKTPLDLESATPSLESPLDPLSVTPAIEETDRQFDLYRREAPETPQQTEHMAELEAELEAELDALTSSITDVASGPPDFKELDPEGVAGVADRDLGVEGLPAAVDWDDDNDDFITEEPAHSGGGVPPRELSRLLRKVQSSRQEYRIAELEADLQEAVEKLLQMENEVRLLREKAMSFTLPPSAATHAEGSARLAKGVLDGLVNCNNSQLSTKSERLNASMLEDLESGREESNTSDARIADRNMGDTHQSSGEESASCFLVRQEHESNVLGLLASEPVCGQVGSAGRDLASHLLAREASELNLKHSGAQQHTSCRQEAESGGTESIFRIGVPPTGRAGLITRRSVSSMFSSMESMNSEAQADNDAVCDEFLSSVFCSPDGSQLDVSSVMSSPLLDQMPLSSTPEENREASAIPKDVPIDSGATGLAEDLDEVVGQLLKRDSSSVKNAINAFLRWEAAEKDDALSKDDTGEEEASIPGYSRRAAGKNPTPQKTPVLSSVSSSLTPQKTSVVSARLEQLARTAFPTEKMSYGDKPVGNARVLGFPSDEKSPGGVGGKADVFQTQQPTLSKLDDRSPKAVGLWEYSVTKRDHSSQPLRRGEGPGKGETSMTDTLRDLFRGESPVFGGGDRDFQALLDTRRELRYSSSKVQLSLTGSDTASVFRQRDDSSRAGTNSPVGRPPTRNAFQSPKQLKHSRMAFENSLYQNPTSDWLAEVGSPPDLD